MLQINREICAKIAEKSNFDINDLIVIIEILRSEYGCPWDREQTHSSLKNSLIEETYEVIEAINNNSSQDICEELGDLLMLIILNAQIAKEENSFDFSSICDTVSKKMILRHPHVFKNTKVKNSQEVLKNWDDIKKEEKSQKTYTDTLKAVPNSFPALLKAEKVQKRAKKAGFDWDNINGALQKVYEEVDEISEEIKTNNTENAQKELGDLLFATVNLSRFLKANPEDELNKATLKFISRFSKVEELANKKGIDMKAASLTELDLLWEEVKKNEN